MHWLRGVTADMKTTAQGIFGVSTLRNLSDDQLTEIITNTEMNQASLMKFYNSLVNERVRRGLHLSDERVLDDDAAPLF